MSVYQLVKRIRKVKTLAYIIGHLKSQMPNLMGKEKKQQQLINDLPNVFRVVLKKYNLAPGDFPVSQRCAWRMTCTRAYGENLLSTFKGYYQFLRKAARRQVF
jgi:biotin synthase-related radical SAM superfamily protein